MTSSRFSRCRGRPMCLPKTNTARENGQAQDLPLQHTNNRDAVILSKAKNLKLSSFIFPLSTFWVGPYSCNKGRP